jgi:hypothetical protein
LMLERFNITSDENGTTLEDKKGAVRKREL